MKGVCRGGFRSLEVTNKGNGWNLHAHELVDAGWIAHYPQWDIERGPHGWKVVKKHKGIAREFTRQCQRFPELRSTREDFDLDNPNDWYFIDLRTANSKAADEITKYVTKGSQVVKAGAVAVLEYLASVRNLRMVQPFGSMLNVNLDEEAPEEPPPRRGECPYSECPEPSHGGWDFVGYGYPGGRLLEFNSETGTSRIVGVLTELKANEIG